MSETSVSRTVCLSFRLLNPPNKLWDRILNCASSVRRIWGAPESVKWQVLCEGLSHFFIVRVYFFLGRCVWRHASKLFFQVILHISLHWGLGLVIWMYKIFKETILVSIMQWLLLRFPVWAGIGIFSRCTFSTSSGDNWLEQNIVLRSQNSLVLFNFICSFS